VKVLQVTPRYLPHAGGIETHVKEVSHRLRQSDLEVSICTTVVDEAAPGQDVVDGVLVRRFASWPRNRDYCFSPDLYQAVRVADCDVIHVQGVHTFVAPLAMAAAKRAGIPYVLTFHTGGHSSLLRRSIRGLQWRSMAPLLKSSSLLIGVSQYETQYFASVLRLPESRFRVVPNGGRLPEVPAYEVDESKLIISSGRLERYKGHHRAIAAMPEVLKSEPASRLVILGTGPHESRLRQQIAELGLEASVEIRSVPAGQRQEMATLLASASLVVLLSDYEAHPVAAMEAIALERPVLVLDNSGLRELASKGWATAIANDSSTAEIARAMIQQLRTPAYPPRVSLPTWDDCARSLREIYQQVARVPACA
jgi:glycosyltransferase involved in cell wall biosynthesis